jgi:FixJ family two-component response regulator
MTFPSVRRWNYIFALPVGNGASSRRRKTSSPIHENTIRSAIRRSEEALSQQAAMEVLRQRYASLNHHERDVMSLVVSGHLNKQVGAELNLSEITVKAHRGELMRIMNARSLADLVAISEKLGLTPSSDN